MRPNLVFSAAMALALMASSTLMASSAHAQSAEEAAAAETLFREAQTLYKAGDLSKACPKFEASYELAPGLGTLLNLARCYDEDGKTASAWARYVDLQSLAARAGQADRVGIAKKAIAKLEPTLNRLRIQVPNDARVPGLEVMRDDIVVSAAAFGVPLAVDPGKVRITASAEGYQPWSQELTVAGAGKTLALSIPKLEPVAAAPVPDPVPPVSPNPLPPRPDPLPPVPPMPEADPTLYIVGGITLGFGVVALGVGGGFAGSAASTWSDAGCTPPSCPSAEAQTLSEAANREADIATGFMVGGGVVAAAGVAVLIAAAVGNSSDEQAAGWSLTPTGVRLRF